MSEFCPKCESSKNCWSQNVPQLICNCDASSCHPDENCCSSNCLSCEKEDRSVCNVCRKKVVGSFPIQKCVDSCPSRTYDVRLLT